MKKIIIAVVALLFLGGGGFAVWKFVLSKPKTEEAHPAPAEGAGPAYVELEPFTVSVIREDRVSRQVSIQVKLEVDGATGRATVTEKMPLLQDALLTRLHILLSRGSVEGQSFDAPQLKRQFLAECDRVLGKGVVREVLIDSSQDRIPR